MLQDFRFFRLGLQVYVISDDGWSWALAWAQLGVATIRCVPFSGLALEQLKVLQAHSALGNIVQVVSPGYLNLLPTAPSPEQAHQLALVCAHFATPPDAEEDWPALESFRQALQLREEGQGRVLAMASIPATQRAVHSRVRAVLGDAVLWQEIRHRNLGGLTSARLLVGWHGARGAGDPTTVAPGRRRAPIRPLDRFLEPAVPLAQWKRAPQQGEAGLGYGSCWRPLQPDARPFPWPWKGAPLWVEAPSVFLVRSSSSTVERPLTVKERCQLLDLRGDWGSTLLEAVWAWNDGASVPLRLLVEFIMAGSEWLRQSAITAPEQGAEPVPDSCLLTKEANEEQTNIIEDKIDWGRVRAPWLGRADTTCLGQTDLERMVYFGWVWEPQDVADKGVTVATKSDDAEVDLKLWAVGGDGAELEQARAVLRVFLLRRWSRSLCREACRWLRGRDSLPSYQVDREAIVDCVTRCSNSTWWDWADGSRLLFWRWPPVWQSEARDGARGFHFGKPRRRLHYPQVPIKEDWIVAKDQEKLIKLLRRRYIVPGPCQNTVPRFPVPKGADDIRVVWDLAKNGLNEHMYTPSFFLATMGTYLRRIEAGVYGGDFDIGEQFHNYMLHETEQVYCGVEIPQGLVDELRAEGLHVDRFMRWSRLVFGWQSSPYFALRMLARAIELVKGNPSDQSNAFSWAEVVLNLPGDPLYDPGRPRVMKRRIDGLLAADVVSFYDDGRVFGPTELLAKQALRQATSRLQFLGNQDAARKRRPLSQRPGAWAGGVAYTDQGLVRKFVTQSKWDKAKAFLDWVETAVLQGAQGLDRARFLSGTGFLVHMSMTYDFIQPYLKGFHLSADAWRSNRNEGGWKTRETHRWDEENFGDEGGPEPTGFDLPERLLEPPAGSEEPAPPPLVQPVPLLRTDVRDLKLFFEADSPVQVLVRPVEGAVYVAYGAGDASGEGFGSRIKPLGLQPLLRRGFWCTEDSEESSNWRELRNLVDAIREESVRGRLVGREVWLATDNTTAATAFYKGSSSSEALHQMVTELRLLTLRGNFILHLFHIAGTRMIEIGVDGLSRGELQLGALENLTPDSAIPLHLTALQRSPGLRLWLDSWLTGDFRVTQPSDWFHSAQQAEEYDEPATTTNWVWDLPPAAAIHAIEELGYARLKRHETLRGIVLVPNLLRNEWFRRFSRVVDFYLTIPAGSIPEWPATMHESLTVGFYLPILRHQPWDWKRVPFLVPFGASMSKMYKQSDPSTRDHLRQFWASVTKAPSLPQRLVSDLLHDPSWRRFLGVSAIERRRGRNDCAGRRA